MSREIDIPLLFESVLTRIKVNPLFVIETEMTYYKDQCWERRVLWIQLIAFFLKIFSMLWKINVSHFKTKIGIFKEKFIVKLLNLEGMWEIIYYFGLENVLSQDQLEDKVIG